MNIIEIIIYIGLAQGLMLGMVLNTIRRGNRAANRILGIILIIFSSGMLLHVLGHSERADIFRHHKEMVMLFFLMVPVLFFHYVQLLSRANRKLTLVHWIGPGTGLAVFVAHFFLDDSYEKLSHEIISGIVILLVLIYIPLTFRSLHRHNRAIRESFSSIEKINLNWLRNLMIAFTAAWILTAIVEALNIGPLTGDIIWLIISVFIYWIGYMGLVQPEIFTGEMNDAVPDGSPLKKKYEKSTLTEDKASEICSALNALMKDRKPYLDPDITLPGVAKMLSVTTHELSQVINEKFGQNFFEFINQRRIEESKRLMDDPNNDHLNIAAIGYTSGFNSISAFNSAFKKFSDMTPSQYRNRKNS